MALTVPFERLKHGFLLFLLVWPSTSVGKINVHELRCEVCQRTVEEMVIDVDSVDPDKKIHVGEFMLDHKGMHVMYLAFNP